MTIRSVALGLALGLTVAAGTYFNDFVIRQTPLLGSYLPMAIFGVVAALALVWNPLAGRVTAGLRLRQGELVVVLAIALACAGWAGVNFFRSVGPVSASPGYWNQTQASWGAQGVMSYVPGGSGEVAAGHLPRPASLAEWAWEQRRRPTAAGALWRHTDGPGRAAFRKAAGRSRLDSEMIQRVAAAVNAALRSEGLALDEAAPGPGREAMRAASAWQRARWNRGWVAAALPELVRPAPEGEGVLLSGGEANDAVRLVMTGGAGSLADAARAVPWDEWWPVVRLWWGMAVLLGLVMVCLALIFHPQWSRHELLPYPIARFVEELLERRPGEAVPAVTRSRPFWVAMAGVSALHLLNGAHAWVETLPHLPMELDLNPLRELFPNASRAPGSGQVFGPSLYLSVAAFAFFLPTQVSFSIGVAPLVWTMFGAALIANGMPAGFNRAEPDPGTLLRLGGYVGLVGMIGYTGRRYYAEVIRAGVALGGARSERAVPSSAVWAGRALAVLIPVSVWWLTTAGLAWPVALLMVGACLLVWVVVARVVCETGAPMVTGPLLPVAALTGLLGEEALGPTALVVLGVMGIVLVGDPRDAALPFLMHGLRLTDRGATPRPGRLAGWLAGATVLGIAAAGLGTLIVQHQQGLSSIPLTYPREAAPQMPFRALASVTSQMSAEGVLARSVGLEGLERVGAVSPAQGFFLWVPLGVAIVVGTWLARFRLPWWPLHPAMFIIIGTQASFQLGFSFLVAWMLKGLVVQTSGARGFEAVKPAAVGVIAGELLTGLLWVGFGTVYYFWTGLPPESYSAIWSR